jgi:ribosomal protein S18 acetylase RimI-like enzyme
MAFLTVRQAVLADLDTLAPLFDAYRRFYGCSSDVPAARAFLLERLGLGESVAFIAEDSELGAVGFTQLYPGFSSVSMGRIFVLNDLFVASEARRRGVARALLKAATQYADEVGALRLSLSTAHNNERAQALYQSLGWRRDEHFWTYNLPLVI